MTTTDFAGFQLASIKIILSCIVNRLKGKILLLFIIRICFEKFQLVLC